MDIYLEVVKPQQIGGDNFVLDSFSLSDIKNLKVTEKSVAFEFRGNEWIYKIEELKSFEILYKIQEEWLKEDDQSFRVYLRKPGETLAKLSTNLDGRLDYLVGEDVHPRSISWLIQNGYKEI